MAHLQPDRTNLVIREDRRRGVFVEGLSEWVVRSPAEVYQLMANGQAMVGAPACPNFMCLASGAYKDVECISPLVLIPTFSCSGHAFTPQRATGATKLNEVSSRSHAVCIVIVEKCTTSDEGGCLVCLASSCMLAKVMHPFRRGKGHASRISTQERDGDDKDSR